MARWTIVIAILCWAGTAAAQEQTAPQAGARKEPPRSYQSPMRAECEAELAKDKGWNAELRASLRPEVHQEEAALIQKNKKHVVMAYAALWVLTVLFLVLLWLRQKRLVAELDALEKKVAKAAAE